MDYFDLAMEEYRSLRTEINIAMQNQQSILNYGITSIGIIIAFTTSSWSETIIVDIILLLLVPSIAHLTATIWLGEVNRIARAGRFLSDKEYEINKKYQLSVDPEAEYNPDDDALIWERWIRNLKSNGQDKSIKTKWNYRATLALLMVLLTTSLSIGIYHNIEISERVFGIPFFIFSVFVLLAYFYHFHLLNRIKK